MKKNCNSANITMREYERTLMYNDIEVLFLSIKYPQINIACANAEKYINKQIAMNINEYIKYVNYLYDMAVEGYKNARTNNYPFNIYNAYMVHEITYNENCFLSMYIDKYEYTGGAHGTTERSSNTWELWNGVNLSLSNFFKPGTDYKRFLIEEITRQADYNNRKDPYLYFDDYRALIIKNFNEDSFYLTPDGITIYYQQYDIGPYVSGIIEFTIPYSLIKWYPNC